MALLRFISLVSATSLLLVGLLTRAEDGAATLKIKRANCLPEMNGARAKADLALFKVPSTYKLTSEDGEKIFEDKERDDDETKKFWTNVCSSMREGTKPAHIKNNFDGMLAYSPQAGPSEDCEAATAYWINAITNFKNQLPPPYVKDQPPYNEDRNVSFVSLFNPKETPTAECAFVTCPIEEEKEEGGGDEDEEEKGDEEEEEEGEEKVVEEEDEKKSLSGQTRSSELMAESEISVVDDLDPHDTGRRLSDATKSMQGLVCLMTPNALQENKAPFSEETWAKIVGAFSNNASSVSLSALPVVAVILSFALL